MTRINTNTASLRGLRNLQRSNNLLNTSLTRLSTGLQINTGKDNPAGLIASETLRSQVSVIEQSLKNSNRANNVIATADAGLGEISGLLTQIRGLVQEGLNTGALSQAEIEANQLQIDSALTAINKISANTKFGSDKLLDGTKAFTTAITAADKAKLGDFQVNEALFGGNGSITVAAQITQIAEKGELIYSGGTLTAAATLEVSGFKGSQTVFLGSSATITNIRDAINAVTDVTGVVAEATKGVTLDSAAASADINFSDIRATGTAGTVSIEIINPGGAGALSVNVVSAGDDRTIQVTLAHDGAATTSTADDVIAAVNGDATAKTLAFATKAEAAGTGLVDAFAATALAGTAGFSQRLISEDFGKAHFVDVNVLSGTFSTLAAGGDTASVRDSGLDLGAVINGQVAQTKGLKASISTATLNSSLTFNAANNTLNATATLTITGGGSVFQIGQDVSVAGQVGLGIEAVNTARLGKESGKLYELGTGGGKSLLDVGPTVNGSALVKILDEALDEVNTLRGRLGALQKNVIETNIAALGVALESISDARSSIVDTDFAAETASLTRAQILSQSGLSVLAIANQNPSQVLSLLG